MSVGDPFGVIPALRRLHLRMLEGIWEQLQRAPVEELSAVTEVRGGDAIFRIDQRSEEILIPFCEEWGRRTPFLLVAEGISDCGERMFPEGADPERAQLRLLMDPIDGTRGLMYHKRSAWILSGAAPDNGPDTNLRDIRWSVMTELPTRRARYADQLWAAAGEGAQGMTYDLSSDSPVEAHRAVLSPSRATDLRQGWAAIAKFFPGGKELTARLEEALFHTLLGPPVDGTPQVFDDEYVSTGGQLYELMAGHDRFTADLRALILPKACAGEAAARLCVHAYDLAAELIAREAGVVVTGPDGSPLSCRMDVHESVAWIGYANETLRAQIEPVLRRLLREHGLFY